MRHRPPQLPPQQPGRGLRAEPRHPRFPAGRTPPQHTPTPHLREDREQISWKGRGRIAFALPPALSCSNGSPTRNFLQAAAPLPLSQCRRQPAPQAAPFPSSPAGFFSRDYYFGRVLSSALRQGAVRGALLSLAGPLELSSGPEQPQEQWPLLHRVTVSWVHLPSVSPKAVKAGGTELWAGDAALSKGSAQPDRSS